MRTQRRDHRVDQHRRRHQFAVGIARIDHGAAKNHHLQVDPDLRRGKACTVGRCHGLAHVCKQRLKLGGIEHLHRLGLTEQTGIAHLENFANGHGFSPLSKVASPASSSTGTPNAWAFSSLLPASEPATT